MKQIVFEDKPFCFLSSTDKIIFCVFSELKKEMERKRKTFCFSELKQPFFLKGKN